MKLKGLINKANWLIDSEFNNALKWSLIGTVGTKVISLLSTVILARLMTPDGYGKYFYIISTIAFFIQIIGLSISAISTRNVAVLYEMSKEKCGRYISVSLLTATLLGIIGFLIMCLLISLFRNTKILEEYPASILYFVSISLITEILFSGISGVFSGLKIFRTINIIIIIISLIRILTCIIFFYIDNVNGSIFGWAVSSIFGLLISLSFLFHLLIHKGMRLYLPKYTDSKEEIRLFFELAIPITIRSSVILLTFWIIQTMIQSEPIIGKSQLAYFSISNQWKGFVTYLPSIFITALLPFLSSRPKTDLIDNTVEFFNKSKSIIIFLAIFLSILSILFSKVIINFYGAGFEEIQMVLVILLIPTVFTSLNALYNQFFLSEGDVWKITVINILSSCMMLIVFVSLMRFMTLSISFAVAISFNELITYLLYRFIRKRVIIINKGQLVTILSQDNKQ